MPGKASIRLATSALFMILSLAFATGACAVSETNDRADVLPSWNDGPNKQSIIDFVRSVTDEKSPDYVKPEERIAVFDNDGTLFCEQPMYTQIVFAMDRAKQEAEKHPEYKSRPQFRAPVSGDSSTLIAGGARGSMELIAAAHTGMSTEQFAQIVKSWTAKAKHPRFKHPYVECVYKPMLEVLAYLRENGFKNYIVSGGGIEFMRPWTEKAYGIPPEQIIGSNCTMKFDDRSNHPTIYRTGMLEFVDDADQKPIAIEKVIGRRPIAAFGNSDDDRAMLEWTAAGPGKRLGVLIHHTDAEREFDYDRKSKIGHLEKALDEAQQKHWTVVDMKSDWKKVFPFEN